MKSLKTSYWMNICIFILELVAALWMVSGITIFAEQAVFTASKWLMFRYFTVDSNILMGIVALIAAVYQRKYMKGEIDSFPVFVYSLKLLGTASVTLTFLVTVFFLAPTATYPWINLFTDSNFLMHFLNPVLSIITLVCFEKTKKLPISHTCLGIVPMLLYAVYYVGAAVMHSTDGVIEYGYDWYGFFFAGLKSGVIVVPLVIVITYCISFVLWKLNRSFIKE